MKYISILSLFFIVTCSFGQTIRERTNPVNVDYSNQMNQEAPVKSSRKYRALIMGVSKYKYEDARLQSLDRPANDAQEIYNLLTQYYTFESEDVILLKDPTRSEIIDAFDKISRVTTDKDNLLVFYAGHGYWDKQRELGYWLPSDAKRESRSDWISNSDVKDNLAISSIKSKHTLLITDACFGGSIFKSRAMTTDRMLQINELYREPSRKAMTSGNLSEVPDKSIFLQLLINKLRDNEDDYLPALTLYTRIYEPIINNSSTHPVYGIIQGAGDGGGDFIFERRKN
ncbi:MAG TPA: caspase family protein [Cyclobacteriaceae bacterium]|nr:caspase family protein [Cyclobacteriaceae bacterium]